MGELTNYANLASLTAVCYDYLMTFGEEVELVWSRRFTLGTALFLLNRYLPFIDMPISVAVYLASRNLSAMECRKLILGSTPIIVLGVAASEFILVLRTIAIWNRNKCVLIGLLCCQMITIAIAVVFTALYLQDLKFISNPGEGCVVVYVGNFAWVDILSILFIESIIVVLTGIRAFHHLRYSSSSWVHQLYQRGILYFLLLFVFVLLNTIFPLLAPLHLKLLFMKYVFHLLWNSPDTTMASVQRALHSILCNRMLFQILQQKDFARFGMANSYDPPKFEETNSQFQFGLGLDTFTTPDEKDERLRATRTASTIGISIVISSIVPSSCIHHYV
ncbi:hypothetical protein CPB83DRAFT_842439 [Crepidotus variabilis]|uniref:DUF6533 domain-containing protein n=1 Tax=Crepidotus variabilis TaxID=179855 RepID=A0A9P6EVN9_9AGAR|nr:hypothetical protein CPB83DRAFT_842439 [Crepidotus variabilis]